MRVTHQKVAPAMDARGDTGFSLGGAVGDRLRNVTSQWLLPAPGANPAMLEMFRDRDRPPLRNWVPWAGEFAGKHLSAAVQVLRLTGDETLRQNIRRFVAELISLQDRDGYLGPWAKGHHLTGTAPSQQCGATWDAWGHYHIMLGLILWHRVSHDRQALAAAVRIGDLMCRLFLGKKKRRLVDTGSTEMNLAPAHSLCLLYRATEKGRYLQLARQIVDQEFAATDAKGRPLAGDYLRTGLVGQEFFDTPKPRWESLHPMMAMAELYYLTGVNKYRLAFENHWRSMVSLDRHNNGGFTAGEQAQGNPFHQSAIETCCTVAFIAYGVEMLRLTGDPLVADELELATLNSIMGAIAPSGRWATYNTPMDGTRLAALHEIHFQARAGQPELNCCSVNAPRGLGLVGDWAVMTDAEGLVVNWYGPSTFMARTRAGVQVKIVQVTQYPQSGRVTLTVSPSRTAVFGLKLRIPRWSLATRVTINGRTVNGVVPGIYLALNRKWQSGDAITIHLDLSFHFWIGRKECEGKTSVYRGPILLAYDRRYNTMSPDRIPLLRAETLKPTPVRWLHWRPPALLLEFVAANEQKLRLCDFASAGDGGSYYASWLKVGFGKSRRRQPFATDPCDLVRADLIRSRQALRRLADARRDDRQTQESFLRIIGQTRVACRHVADDLKRARVLAETPSAAGQRLRAFLADESSLLGAVQELDRQEARLRARHPQLPQVLSRFEATKVQSIQRVIQDVALPGKTMVFGAVTGVGDSGFADLRGFHGGRHGIVYVRAQVNMRQSGEGTLRYGADGPVKVWVNRRVVGGVPDATNPAVADAYRCRVHWRKGTNTVTMALCTNHGMAWGVYATAAWD